MFALWKHYVFIPGINLKIFLFFFFSSKQMIHNYMEHLERTKLHQLSGSDQLESTAHSRIR